MPSGIEVQESDCGGDLRQAGGGAACSEGAERREYLQSAGVERTKLETLITAAYQQARFVVPDGQARSAKAWTIPRGRWRRKRLGRIHTDFVKHFISAKGACSYADFVAYGGWKGAAEKGCADRRTRIRDAGRGCSRVHDREVVIW